MIVVFPDHTHLLVVPCDSTTCQLLHTYHIFVAEAVDTDKEVRTVYCDINKAFDQVWHKGLLQKLRGIRCSEIILAWFSSYLSGRKKQIVSNGKFSKWVEVLAGVPHVWNQKELNSCYFSY